MEMRIERAMRESKSSHLVIRGHHWCPRGHWEVQTRRAVALPPGSEAAVALPAYVAQRLFRQDQLVAWSVICLYLKLF